MTTIEAYSKLEGMEAIYAEGSFLGRVLLQNVQASEVRATAEITVLETLATRNINTIVRSQWKIGSKPDYSVCNLGSWSCPHVGFHIYTDETVVNELTAFCHAMPANEVRRWSKAKEFLRRMNKQRFEEMLCPKTTMTKSYG